MQRVVQEYITLYNTIGVGVLHGNHFAKNICQKKLGIECASYLLPFLMNTSTSETT